MHFESKTMKFQLTTKNKWKRIALIVIGVIAGVVWGLIGYLNDGRWTHFRIKTVEAEYRKSFAWTEDELRPALNDGENAAYFMRGALYSNQWMELIDQLPKVRKAIKAEKFSEAKLLLQDYSDGLPRLDKASRMGDFALKREWSWGRRGDPGYYPFSLTIDLIRYQGLVDVHERDLKLARNRVEMLDRFSGLFSRDLSFNGQLGALNAMNAADEIRGAILFEFGNEIGVKELYRPSSVRVDLLRAWRGESFLMLSEARNLGNDPESAIDSMLNDERPENSDDPVLDYSVTAMGRSYQVRVMEASLAVQRQLVADEMIGDSLAYLDQYLESVPVFPETMIGVVAIFPDTIAVENVWRLHTIRSRALGVVDAAVRYRKAHGSWPKSIGDVGEAPGHLRLHENGERLLIYAIGRNGEDELGEGDDVVAFGFPLN